MVIGGGPTGVELVAELGDFVREDVAKYFPQLAGRVKITLIEATDRLLGAFDVRMASYAHTALQQRGAEVLCGAMVTRITKDYVEIKKKSTIATTTATTTTPTTATTTAVPPVYNVTQVDSLLPSSHRNTLSAQLETFILSPLS